jgi:superfamily I DNA/RNA helicase
VNVVGRATTLRVNYRTSHQIRRQADRLLAAEVSDLDGNVEERRGATSVFNGPEPAIEVLASHEAEKNTVSDWLRACSDEGIAPDEMAVFVRSPAQLDRAADAVERAGLTPHILDERVETKAGRVAIGTMHLAKGLEFRVVAVMACDEDVIPLEERILSVTDDADLEDVYNTERQLLYVACTRARDQLIVTAVDPASEFLDDMVATLPSRANTNFAARTTGSAPPR